MESVMNTSQIELAFLLDQSGSMQFNLESAISGFNQFLREQKAVPGGARFTLVLFDDLYEVTCDGIPISEVVELDTTTYTPRGSTALLDAMGTLITDLHHRVEAMPADARPAKVIVAVLTDGEENASTKFTMAQISELIARQRTQSGWEFFFLGANQDAIATATQLNIDQNNAMTFSADADGNRSAQAAASRKIVSTRKYHTHVAMTPEEEQDLEAPLSHLGAIENENLRKRLKRPTGTA